MPALHPTYTAVASEGGPVPALTLTTHLPIVRSAMTAVLDAFGVSPEQRTELSTSAAASFGHRLYVNEDVWTAVSRSSPVRRRILGRAYRAEVRRLASWSRDTVARAADLSNASDVQLDTTMSILRDELAWAWSIAAVGAALDRDLPTCCLDGLLTALPEGASWLTLTGRAPRLSVNDGVHAGARAWAERVALTLSQSLAAASRVRAARLIAAGSLKNAEDGSHLTWDEFVAAPPDLDAIVERRRAEHDRLVRVTLPSTISAAGAGSALVSS
jgi:hypothetical protein